MSTRIDWHSVYEITKDLGIPVLTFALGILLERSRSKRAERKEEQRRAEDARAADDAARERRVAGVVEAYMDGAKGARILGEDGALQAGVLELRDWTEVRDFCARAANRVTRSGDAPVPPGRREQVSDEQLLAYFQAWRDLRAQRGQFNLEELFSTVRTLAAPQPPN